MVDASTAPLASILSATVIGARTARLARLPTRARVAASASLVSTRTLAAPRDLHATPAPPATFLPGVLVIAKSALLGPMPTVVSALPALMATLPVLVLPRVLPSARLVLI